MCNFALKKGLWIAQPKCPDDVVLWTRLQDCNTIRGVLAIHNIDILIVIWNIQSNHSVQNRLTSCFPSIQTRLSLLTISWQKLNSFQDQKHDKIFIWENFNVFNRFIYILDGKIMQKKSLHIHFKYEKCTDQVPISNKPWFL